jgi:hypothetical protein
MVERCKGIPQLGNQYYNHTRNWYNTILVIKKLSIQTKRQKVFVCYDFHSGIFDDEMDVMFATKLNLFSIITIVVTTHTEPIPKPICILDIIMAKPILKQHVIPLNVLNVKLIIPLDIVKQHLLETFFHLEVGEMVVDETPT